MNTCMNIIAAVYLLAKYETLLSFIALEHGKYAVVVFHITETFRCLEQVDKEDHFGL